MSAMPMDFKITPPKVKPHRGISLARLVLRPLVCVLGPPIAPLIVYLMEGSTNLFWWMLGFGSFISILLLMFDLGIFKDVMKCLKISCCGKISRRKLVQTPSHCKNLSPMKLSSAARNSPGTLRLDLPHSTTQTIVDIPISLDCPFSNSLSDELNVVGVSQQLEFITPTKRRVISASSVSLSPLRNETKASAKTSPFSKRRSGFPGCLSPSHQGLQETSHLSTILESPYPDCIVDNSQSRRPSCFSS